MRPTASTPPHWPDPWTFVQLKGMDQNSCRRPPSQLSNQSLFEVRPRFPQPVSQCSCRGHVLVVLTLMVVCFCTVATGDRSSPRTRRPNPLEIDSAPAAWKCRATKLQICMADAISKGRVFQLLPLRGFDVLVAQMLAME